jgi:serpin B
MKILAFLILAAIPSMPMAAAETDVATSAINRLGLEIFAHSAKPDQNFLLSPYSIQSALAMASAGADGKTREEMSRALHFPASDSALQVSFSTLAKALTDAATSSAELARQANQHGAKKDILQLHVANRLFGQKRYHFQPAFLSALATGYGAPFEEVDFAASPDKARTHINGWVEGQTRNKIVDLIPPNGVNAATRLVLTNALYFKAAWMEKFEASATKPLPFKFADGRTGNTPTMFRQMKSAYAAHEGFVAVGLPYDLGELQFLILLPDTPDGLANLKKKLTPEILTECAKMPASDLTLFLPKLKLQPDTLPLRDVLEALGLKTAFDDPKGSANFARMAPRKPGDYLAISEVFHKTFLSLDEEGTEAAAATAMAMEALGIPQFAKRIEIKVDRPFLFAIQHRPSGACLFLGQVVDPRY